MAKLYVTDAAFDVANQCLQLHGLSRIVLAMDPFLGLGSSAVACAELGVNFVGVEIDRSYLDEAIERVRGVIAGGRKRARTG